MRGFQGGLRLKVLASNPQTASQQPSSAYISTELGAGCFLHLLRGAAGVPQLPCIASADRRASGAGALHKPRGHKPRRRLHMIWVAQRDEWEQPE